MIEESKLSKLYKIVHFLALLAIVFLLIVQLATSDEIVHEIEVTHATDDGEGVYMGNDLCTNKNDIKNNRVESTVKLTDVEF